MLEEQASSAGSDACSIHSFPSVRLGRRDRIVHGGGAARRSATFAGLSVHALVAFAVAAALVAIVPSSSLACDAGGASVETFLGFEPDGRSYWVLIGGAWRDDRGGGEQRLHVYRYAASGRQLEKRSVTLPTQTFSSPLGPEQMGPPKPWRPGARFFVPPAHVLAEAARVEAQLTHLRPGRSAAEVGLSLHPTFTAVPAAFRTNLDEQDRDDAWCGPSALSIAVRSARGEVRRITKVRRDHDGVVRLGRHRLHVSPHGAYAVFTAELDYAINWHQDDVSVTRRIDLDRRCLRGTRTGAGCERVSAMIAAADRVCRSEGEVCSPQYGQQACGLYEVCFKRQGAYRCEDDEPHLRAKLIKAAVRVVRRCSRTRACRIAQLDLPYGLMEVEDDLLGDDEDAAEMEPLISALRRAGARETSAEASAEGQWDALAQAVKTDAWLKEALRGRGLTDDQLDRVFADRPETIEAAQPEPSPETAKLLKQLQEQHGAKALLSGRNAEGSPRARVP